MKKKFLAMAFALGVMIPSAFMLTACEHEHKYGEWTTKTAATCESAEIEHRTCECGEEQTRTGDPATGHTYSIDWSTNATHHWKEATCGHSATSEFATHVDTNTDDICDTCLHGAVAQIGTNYYSTLEKALTAAENNATITLVNNIVINKCVEITKNITIDGQSRFSIINSNTFDREGVENPNMFTLNTANTTFTLKNVNVDAKEESRIIKVTAGTFKVDGANLTGGKADTFAGGVFITNAGRFEMTSGTIQGNKVSTEYASDNYVQYTADLWIGANAEGVVQSTISGGYIENAFINANEHSATNAGDFTLDGGTIKNIYVEYDDFGAKFIFTSGVVEKLYLSTTTTGTAQVITTPTADHTYIGGEGSLDA